MATATLLFILIQFVSILDNGISIVEFYRLEFYWQFRLMECFFIKDAPRFEYLNSFDFILRFFWFLTFCLFLSGEKISFAKHVWRPRTNFFQAVDQSVISFTHKSNNFPFRIFYKRFGIHQRAIPQTTFFASLFEAEFVQTNEIPRAVLFTSKKALAHEP